MPRRTTRTMQACAVFCATPTTAAVERIFSTAGFVISSRRTSLSDEMFEFLWFNHLNSDLRIFGAIVDEIVNGRKRKFKDISSLTIIGKTLGNIGMRLCLRPHIGYWDGNFGKNIDIGCWDWYWGKLYWASTDSDVCWPF